MHEVVVSGEKTHEKPWTTIQKQQVSSKKNYDNENVTSSRIVCRQKTHYKYVKYVNKKQKKEKTLIEELFKMGYNT